MNKGLGFLGSLIAIIAIAAALNFISEHLLVVLSTLGAIVTLWTIIYMVHTKRKNVQIESTFKNIVTQSETYFQKFNIIAERKSCRYDEYGDEQFNEESFQAELEILLDKICSPNLVYATEIRRKLAQYAIDKYNSHSNRAKISEPIAEENSTGIDFENSLLRLFTRQGYVVTLTGKTGDQGADLIMKRKGKKIIVQAKYYNGTVGNKAVQEIIAAVGFYNGDEGWVVTNSDFTKSAVELAVTHNITLINGYQLKKHYNFQSNSPKMIVPKKDYYLDSSTQGFLYDILVDMRKISEDSIDDRQHSVHKVRDVAVLQEEYRDVILYDISQIADMLEIDLGTESKERSIVIAAFYFFCLDDADYKLFLQNDMSFESNSFENYFLTLEKYHTQASNLKITGYDYFVNYRPTYLSSLKNIAALMAETKTKYNLTRKEQKVLNFYNQYISKKEDLLH